MYIHNIEEPISILLRIKAEQDVYAGTTETESDDGEILYWNRYEFKTIVLSSA